MDVCRLCLNHSTKPHYPLHYGNPSIREKLRSCIPELEEFHVQKAKVCQTCSENLNIAYNFRTKCLTSLQIIKDIMGTNKQNNIDDCLLSYKVKSEKEDVQHEIIKQKPKESPPLPSDPIELDPIQQILQNTDLSVTITKKLKLDHRSNTTDKNKTIEESTPPILPIETVEIKSERMSPPPDIFPESSNSNIMNDLMCRICFRQYPNNACLLKHLKSAHNICKEEPEKICSPRRFKRLVNTISKKDMRNIRDELKQPCFGTICAICGITFSCNHELKYHNGLCHSSLPVQNVSFNVYCHICKFSINHKYIREHVATHMCTVVLEDIFKEVNVSKNGTFVIVKEFL